MKVTKHNIDQAFAKAKTNNSEWLDFYASSAINPPLKNHDACVVVIDFDKNEILFSANTEILGYNKSELSVPIILDLPATKFNREADKYTRSNAIRIFSQIENKVLDNTPLYQEYLIKTRPVSKTPKSSNELSHKIYRAGRTTCIRNIHYEGRVVRAIAERIELLAENDTILPLVPEMRFRQVNKDYKVLANETRRLRKAIAQDLCRRIGIYPAMERSLIALFNSNGSIKKATNQLLKIEPKSFCLSKRMSDFKKKLKKENWFTLPGGNPPNLSNIELARLFVLSGLFIK